MALKYTEEKLSSLNKETLIQLFLSQQEQLEKIDHTLQLVLEQMADLKRCRFGRSSEKHETEDQISFMEVDGKIVFFNESATVSAEYQQTRNASHPREFLKNFSGVCVTDGYQFYHTIEGERKDLKIAGCWSHARRRFDEAVKALSNAKQKDSRAYLALP